MKRKRLFIIAIIFFLIVTTTYYWEGKLGLFSLPTFIILVIVYFGLFITFIKQIYLATKENPISKHRVFMIGLLAVILALTFYKPFGIIDFSKFEGADLLVAEREGSANSNTTLKLKEDFTFKERDINFGINEIKGNYHLQNDTIYFDNVNIGRSGNGFYKFAIIKPSIFSNDKIVADLIMFKELTDTTGRLLWITKNQLDKLKAKKQGR